MRPFSLRSRVVLLMVVLLATGMFVPHGRVSLLTLANAATTPPAAPVADDDDDDDDAPSPMDTAKTPEQRMQARYPQPVRVGDLIGQAILDGDHVTIGYVQRVVRAPDGKIKLIVPYRSWLAWASFLNDYGSRPVAVPIEVLGSMGQAISSIDMKPEAYGTIQTWVRGADQDIQADEIIRIAIARE